MSDAGTLGNDDEQIRYVTLGRLTPHDLRERLSGPGHEARILARVICAMYWGGKVEFDLQEVERLSAQNWALAVEIMAYRRSPIWSEAHFHVIALWCRDRFELHEWQHDL